MAPNKDKKIEKAIEAAWYRLAQGVEIDVMNIPKVFAEAKVALKGGQDLDTIIVNLIAKYRANPDANFMKDLEKL